MSSNEDYLDSLLRAAMEPPKPPSLITDSMTEKKVPDSPEPEVTTESEAVAEAEIAVEPETIAEVETATESAMGEEPELPMEPETVAESELAMGSEIPDVAEEEAPAVDIPVSADENRSLSPDEFAAMFAMPEQASESEAEITNDDIEVPSAEELDIQESEAVADAMAEDIASVSADFDGNQKMSQDDIEALLAGIDDGGEDAKSEPELSEMSDIEASEEPMDLMTDAETESEELDGSQQMSQDDIEALLAGIDSGEEEADLESELSEMSDIEASEESMDLMTDAETESEELDGSQQMSQDDIEALLAGIEDSGEAAETEPEESDGSRQMSQDDIEALLAGIDDEDGADDADEQEKAPAEQEMAIDLEGVEDIDALLGIKEMPENYKEDMLQDGEADSPELDETEPDLEDQELSDILDLLGGDDSELAEINDILKKSDNNEVVDGEGIDEMMADVGSDADSRDEESADSKPKKKKRLFGKKSKKSDAESGSDENAEAVEGETPAEGEEGSKPEKKKGLFAKLFDTLTEEAEDETETAETEGEEKPKKEKKGKKGKKKGKGADAAASNEEILDEMAEEDEAAAKKKKKKEKKPKKVKEPKIKKVKEPELEEPVKKLPKKMVIRIFVLCFSILAVILIFNAFVPRMLSLQRARSLFYKGDYESSYKELIMQKKLSESDEILLRKAELLMHMKRKKDLYDAYEKADLKAEGLNCLLEAAAYYNEKQEEFAVYGISYEAEQTYILISSTLTDVYGLSPERVNEILQMDKISYTHLLKQMVSGDTAGMPADETDVTENPEASGNGESNDAVAEPEELDDPLEAEFD